MRDAITEVQSDFLTRIVRPGAFKLLETGIDFHYRDRGPGGELLGIFMNDTREQGQSNVYLAETGIAAKLGDAELSSSCRPGRSSGRTRARKRRP